MNEEGESGRSICSCFILRQSSFQTASRSMPLTLEQYADYLDKRQLSWPSPPEVVPPKARPYLVRLPNIRAVTWSAYGTLLAITGGELYFEHPNQFVMEVALDKTVQEFKMWPSMSRKPGQPANYLQTIYSNLLAEQQLSQGGVDKNPEIIADRLWESFIKKLIQKDYQIDAGFYGSLNEFGQKVAYFFHANLQATACYAGVVTALRHVVDSGLTQGLLADGQVFTTVQLQRGLALQDPNVKLEELMPSRFHVLSSQVGVRKPSLDLFRQALAVLGQQGISADQVLHIGSRILNDVAPARRVGMKTGLFAGDKSGLQATPEQLKDPATRPDVLLTNLEQIKEIVPE
jgi:FMN phosphatase YigB (HAD superfamily)